MGAVFLVTEFILNIRRTTYVGQVMAAELGAEPDIDYATRMGEFAMTIYSIGTSLYTIFI